MGSQDWIVTEEGQCEACKSDSDLELSMNPYRLYRFLTDLEDILQKIPDERQRLQAIRPLVRRLLTSSEWLQGEYLEPDAGTGWSVLMLYDEPNFPLTVQTVAWLPGRVSPIHNHATWGVVALISGQEKNTFWKRANNQELSGEIEQVGERIFTPGEIISFLPDAIHSVEALGDEPTITFNLYGETNYEQRFEFDPVTYTARIF